MGYTHYWYKTTTFSSSFVNETLLVLEKKAVAVAATVGDHSIELNGVGKDSHETFSFQESSEFDFCKTNQKPYDVVVTAILALAYEHGITSDVRSDGTPEEWADGIALASEAVGRKVAVPASVLAYNER